MKIVIVIVLVIVILSIALGAYFMMKPSAEESQEAVATLADAAASPSAMEPAKAQELAKTATANIPASNTEATAAVNNLAVAASTPVPVSPVAASNAANIASAGISPCASYSDNDVNLSDACIKDIWFNVAKCPNNSPDTVPYYIENKGTMTKLQITNDAKAWASMTDDGHRKACYGDDRTKWPASYIRYLRNY